MGSLLVKNNAYSTLAGSITDVATSFSVQAGHGARFPAISGGDWYFVTFQDVANNIEIVKITALSSDTFTMERAQEGTAARAWAASDVVEMRLTAGIVATTESIQTLTNKTLAGAAITGEVTNTATSSLQMATGTTAQRPTGAAGKFRFNTSLGKFEGHNGSAWGSVGGGATGGGSDETFVETNPTVTANYTLSTGKNALVVGPLNVTNSATVTVPTGARLVIL